ncbi:unnamed protein product [Ranitomeya imitator]|uniref:Reverse transcriptase domain-containing protein n=1 Tax=Ranitomeya imitator TaxID=111125 RepID=A0ABN9M1L4_9NEOB|nr:unnamed protein product [Ranitomeya imitator]
MGGKCSPSLANITVAVWEEKYIFNENNPFSNNIVFFGRYIDDLIIIWKGDDMLITDFIKYVNNNDFNLSFTFNTSKTSINYLDISLSLLFPPYRKSTDSNSILEAHSCHPKHVIKNIPVGEFIRLKRNCSSAAQFTQETESAVFRLKDRGYPNWMLHRAKSVTKDIDRKSLLWSDNEDPGSLSRNPKKNNNKMKKIKRKRFNENKHTIYSPQYAEIIQIVKKYVPILYSDVKLAHILARTHIRYLAKKAPSLRDILSPSLYLHSITYPIRTHMNCNSEGVIYLIECDLCKLQYVGCTVGPLKRRFCKHISESALNNTSHNISAVSHHCKTIHAEQVDTRDRRKHKSPSTICNHQREPKNRIHNSTPPLRRGHRTLTRITRATRMSPMKCTDQISSMNIRGNHPRIILLTITLPLDQILEFLSGNTRIQDLLHNILQFSLHQHRSRRFKRRNNRYLIPPQQRPMEHIMNSKRCREIQTKRHRVKNFQDPIGTDEPRLELRRRDLHRNKTRRQPHQVPNMKSRTHAATAISKLLSPLLGQLQIVHHMTPNLMQPIHHHVHSRTIRRLHLTRGKNEDETPNYKRKEKPK